MVKQILFLLWLASPSILANVAPIIAAKLPWLKPYDYPMDFGKMYRGKRIFGSHKTWRGFAAGIVVATFVFWLQQLAVEHYSWAARLTDQIDYAQLPTLIMGSLFALGTLGGDAIESFFKRQHGIPPGGGWFPWDQLDSVLGTAVAVLPFILLSWWQYIILIAMMPVIHIVFTHIGFWFGLKERPI
ncbi:MAG TPA: CDP-archaeol synthase [Candidatus Saccharimonadales bacterium]|nr:CDP-archaeol synthase [Candidatus Saccharimonadales bacterium]